MMVMTNHKKQNLAWRIASAFINSLEYSETNRYRNSERVKDRQLRVKQREMDIL